LIDFVNLKNKVEEGLVSQLI